MRPTVSTATKTIYWGSTVLFCLMMLGSAFGYLTSEFFAKAFSHLGFPAYFRIELGIAKILGAIVLLAPVPRTLKEWAYAGFGITLISAFIAHSAVDGVQTAVGPLVALAILAVSRVFLSKMERSRSEVSAVGNGLVAGA